MFFKIIVIEIDHNESIELILFVEYVFYSKLNFEYEKKKM